MKDFDDLWRLSKGDIGINTIKLQKLLKQRKTESSLNVEWIGSEMKRDWKAHSSKYKDLPTDLNELFIEVNRWLKQLFS